MLNQPADLHVDQVKAMLNPEARQWTWATRNMRLRESLVFGSPRADAACPRGFMVEDINCIREAVEKANEMPSGCTRVLGNIPGSPDGQTTVVRLEWSWKDIHEPDEDFDMVLQVLRSRFLAGQTELVAVDGAEASVAADRAGAPVAGAGRPPVASAGTRRGVKRTADEDPVVPVTPTVRRLRHPKAAARFEKTVAAAAAMLVDEERRVSVVRAPYVVGEVKAISAWPHGGIVVFAQFPFLLDPSFNEQGKMVSLCRKLLAFDVGGSYEVMFGPKSLARSTSVVGGANGTEPLLAASGVAPTAVQAGATAGVEGAASDADAAPSATGPVGATGAAGAESSVGTAGVVESVGPTGAAGAASPVAAGGAGGAGGAVCAVGPTGASRASRVGRTPRAPRGVRAGRAGRATKACAKASTRAFGGVVAEKASSGPGAARAVVAPGISVVAGAAGTSGAAGAAVVASSSGAADSAVAAGSSGAAGAAGAVGGSGVSRAAVAEGSSGAVGAAGGSSAAAAAIAPGGAGGSDAAGPSGTAGVPNAIGAFGTFGFLGAAGTAGAEVATGAGGRETGSNRGAKFNGGMGGMVVPPGASPTAPQVPMEYTPLGVDLQRHFERVIRNGHVAGGPAEGELVGWSIVAQSVPTDFSIRCVFSSTMELGRSQNVPCGSHRSNNFVTAAYPARDPMEMDFEELNSAHESVARVRVCQ